MCYSKQQKNVEAIMFFSEFIAQRSSTEAFQLLRFKIWMFGISIFENGATSIICDNESVVNN